MIIYAFTIGLNDENFCSEDQMQDNILRSQERVNLVLSKSQSTKHSIRKSNVFRSQDYIDLSKCESREIITPKRQVLKNSERKNRKFLLRFGDVVTESNK